MAKQQITHPVAECNASDDDKITPLYVDLPNSVYKSPPIARRKGDDRKCVEPFVFTVACSMLSSARTRSSKDDVKLARADGREAMKEQRRLIEEHSAAWHEYKRQTNAAPMLSIKKPPSLPKYLFPYNGTKQVNPEKAIKLAGSAAYAASLRRRGALPANQTVVLSHRDITRGAHLPSRGDYSKQRVEQALDRLMLPVGHELGRVVESWKITDDGKLEVRLARNWLPLLEPGSYSRLPLSIPQHPAACALFIYCFGINTQRNYTHHTDRIELLKLCKILRITTRNKAHAKRALIETLETVNDHLDKFDAQLADALRDLIRPLKVPLRYEISIQGASLKRVEIKDVIRQRR